MTFLDTVLYAFLSFAHIWMLLAWVMLWLKRRKFKAAPSSRERRFYQGVIAVSMITWLWNGLMPTPVLFEDRVGLYWGIKLENARWKIHDGGLQRQPTIAHRGQASLGVQFQKAAGRVVFHHFPTAPQIGRYEAVEFHVLHHDLESGELRVALYSDGILPHPTGGLAMLDRYRCNGETGNDVWQCYRVPLGEFTHPGGGIIGLVFGKVKGAKEGTFFLDDVRLIKKGS